MLVDGVHGDQSDLVVLLGGQLACGSSSGGSGSGQNGDTGIGDLAAQALALQSSNSGLNAFVTHNVGVLSHGGQDVAILDQAQDRIGLIEAHADHVCASGLDSVAGTVGGAFVAAEDTNDTLGDVVLSDRLGLGSVAFAVLGLQQLEAGALKSGAEAFLTGHGGSGSSVDVDDADLAGGDALGGQLVQHGLASGGAGGLVVGGEGGLSVHIGGRVNIDDLHAGGSSFLQSGRDGVGAVGGHDDGLVASGDGVVDLLDLQGVVLGVGSHEGQVHTQLGGGLLSTLLQGDPVLVNGVHGDQRDLVSVGACLSGLLVAAGAACHHGQNHGQAQQNG